MAFMLGRRALMIIAGVVAAVVIIYVLVASGILKFNSNDDCPTGEKCDAAIFFTVTVFGTVQNPNFGTPYATVDKITANATSGPPGASFIIPPRLDFWNNNYQLTMDFCITFPDQQSFCTPKYRTPPGAITGWVGGGGSAGYQFPLYQKGPKGTYSISVTVHYQALGCQVFTCVKMDAQKSASFTI